jgi:hypothetical protein
MLVCVPPSGENDMPSAASIKCEGELVSHTDDYSGFKATVSWRVEYKRGFRGPQIHGRHVLRFSVEKPITETDAQYYSCTNAVVLLYPYVRHLVDDLSLKYAGRSMLVPPLDVPEFLYSQREQRSRQETSTPTDEWGDGESAQEDAT